MKDKRKYIAGMIVLILCIAGFAAIYLSFSPKTDKSGGKSFELSASDGNRSIIYKGKTDALYLSGLMDQLAETDNFTYESLDGEFGGYITSVNGVSADSGQKTNWMVYVNGEFGQYGIDSQPVNDGDSFALRLESYE